MAKELSEKELIEQYVRDGKTRVQAAKAAAQEVHRRKMKKIERAAAREQAKLEKLMVELLKDKHPDMYSELESAAREELSSRTQQRSQRARQAAAQRETNVSAEQTQYEASAETFSTAPREGASYGEAPQRVHKRLDLGA